MKIFVSPHNDDETLFGAFTLLREKPLVIVVFDSYVQAARGLNISAKQREKETLAAMDVLEIPTTEFFGFRDDSHILDMQVQTLIDTLKNFDPEELFLPAVEAKGHHQHNLIGGLARHFPATKITHYMTYTTAGKSVSNKPVEIQDGSWIAKKHRALACYESQMNMDPRIGCYPHFMRDMTEYYDTAQNV